LNEKGMKALSSNANWEAFVEVPLNQLVGLKTTKHMRRERRATTPLVFATPPLGGV
jgi:hypothetical protein